MAEYLLLDSIVEEMRKDLNIDDFIAAMPKTELHLHIEGTFEPELMFRIAQRNKVAIPYQSVEEVKNAYNFRNLQEFLDIYYAGAGVLQTDRDFYDLTWAYMERAKQDNVVHAEIMFDPQTHTDRGIPFDTVMDGIWDALKDANQKLGMSSKLIMSYLRHLDEESAVRTLQSGLRHKDKISAIGLDSSELGNPPSKFKGVFAESLQEGFIPVAHAGEEGPPEYVWEALDLLNVKRVDHGNRALEDEVLVQRLASEKVPLTVCPLSNKELCVVKNMDEHPIREMLSKNLKATINSDDPAYFGGYMNDNYSAVQKALNLNFEEVYILAKNAIEASFQNADEKARDLQRLKTFAGK